LQTGETKDVAIKTHWCGKKETLQNVTASVSVFFPDFPQYTRGCVPAPALDPEICRLPSRFGVYSHAFQGRAPEAQRTVPGGGLL